MLYNMNDYHIELDKLGKVIIYLRKSREDMVDGKYMSDEETLARHEGQLQEWAKKNLGYEIPQDCIFKEVGSGEKINTRPVFQQVLHTLENEDVSGILVVNCSRLSRGSLGDIYQIIKTLEITNTLVLTPMKIYNLKNKYDKRFFQDELTRGNDYLEQVKELLSNGRHWSVSQGKFVGSAAPYGYDTVTCKEMNLADGKGKTLKPNECAQYVKMIFDMFLDGIGTYRIANHLIDINAPMGNYKEWNQCIIRKILTNITYKGYLTWGARATKEKMIDGEVVEYRPKNENCAIYKGLHDAIIDEETFEKVQTKIKTTSESRTPREKVGKNPLATIVKCSLCGKTLNRMTHYDSRTRKRKHSLDKTELQAFMKLHQNKLKISNAELGRMLNLKRHYVYEWFGNNPDKFYPSDYFISRWGDIKKVLKIKDKKFDPIVTEHIEHVKYETLICTTIRCKNVSSNLFIVEDAILNAIKDKYSDYTNYIDNYEKEVVKSLNKSKKASQNIDKDIATIEKQLKNVQIAYEKEAYTLDEFILRKKELNAELEELKNKKANLSEIKEEDKLIRIKKSIPILKNILDNYYSCSPEVRNELLKSIIECVYYFKEKNYTNCGDNKEVLKNIELEICWLID